MFDEKEDLIGLLLLIGCLGSAGVMIWQIDTGTRLRYTGPSWVIWILAVFFFGTSIYGIYEMIRRSRSGRDEDPDAANPYPKRRRFWDRRSGK